MNSSRLEAFSDGVLAIIITIMVLEMKTPEAANLESLLEIAPVFLSYLISFIYLGIYWNNHHHLMQVVDTVDGKVLWANLHLLFWLSLVPFVTSWAGEHHLDAIPIACYGIVLLMSAIAYRILEIFLIRQDMGNEKLRRAISSGMKENISTLLYVLALPLAFVNSWIAVGLYLAVAVIWFLPDRRVERSFREE